MKLLSFGRQKQPADFVFQVEDAFALIEGGVVVAGQVVKGVLRQGEQVVCVTKNGNSFSCMIEMIEQADLKRRGQFIHPKEVRTDGPHSGRCALKIPGWSKSDFSQGDKLISAGSVF